jgi:hypothetical protein
MGRVSTPRITRREPRPRFRLDPRVSLLHAVVVTLTLAGCVDAPDRRTATDLTTSTTTTIATTVPTTTTPTTVPGPARSGESVRALVVLVLLDGERSVEVTLSVHGDWRVDDPDGARLAFDAAARTLHIDASERQAHVRLASSGPDSPHALLDRFLPLVVVSGAIERSARGTVWEGSWEGGATIEFAEHFRRPTLSEGAYGDDLTDHVWVSVDASTLLPVSVTHVSDQRPVEVTVRRWDVVEADVAQVPRERFALWADPPIPEVDHRFEAVGPVGAADHLGYEPPWPSWLPDGFTLTAVDVASDPLLWWSYPSLPPSESLGVFTYRRGTLETITITARSADTGRWHDPYHRGDMDLTGSPHTTPSGRRCSVVTGPWPFWPVSHAWAIGDGLVVTVGGDLSLADLRRVLDGLEW